MRHHDDPPTGGPTGALEQQLVAALHRRAALAPDADQVLRAADAAGSLRRRRHQQVGAGVVLAVAGLAAFAVPRVDDALRAVHPDTARVAGRPEAPLASAAPGPTPLPAPTTPATVPSARAAGGAIPWTLPADEAALAWWRDPTPAVAFDPDLDRAFRVAGYDYEDAVALAELWGHPGDVDYAKVTGGSRLRAGQVLPIAPGSATARALPGDAWDAFTAAGLGVDDAEALAEVWDSPSGFQAARRAGELLLAGQEPPAADPSSEGDDTAVAAFTGAGYDDDDAAQLAELWGLNDPEQAETAGGDNLLAGEDLPLQP